MPSKFVFVGSKTMYIVSVPPLPAIADVSFTHAVAEVELDPLVLQVLEQDSSHA